MYWKRYFSQFHCKLQNIQIQNKGLKNMKIIGKTDNAFRWQRKHQHEEMKYDISKFDAIQ